MEMKITFKREEENVKTFVLKIMLKKFQTLCFILFVIIYDIFFSYLRFFIPIYTYLTNILTTSHDLSSQIPPKVLHKPNQGKVLDSRSNAGERTRFCRGENRCW